MDFFTDLIRSKSSLSSPPAAIEVPKPSHPYYPVDIEIAGFVLNNLTVEQLLAAFATGCTVIFSATWLLTSIMAPRLKNVDKMIALWFCLCKRHGEKKHNQCTLGQNKR